MSAVMAKYVFIVDCLVNFDFRVLTYFDTASTDNTVVNVFPMGNHLYAANETNFLRKLDPVTLETLDEKVIHWNCLPTNV